MMKAKYSFVNKEGVGRGSQKLKENKKAIKKRHYLNKITGPGNRADLMHLTEC